MNAATNARTVAEFEIKTQLKLEQDRDELIGKVNLNKKKEATGDADATAARLVPYADIAPGKMLAFALLELSKAGVEKLVIGPELVAAVNAT